MIEFLFVVNKNKNFRQKSPVINPAIHSWWGISAFGTKGRIIGIVLGKAVFKTSDSPKFNDQWSMINDQWSMINDQWSMKLEY